MLQPMFQVQAGRGERQVAASVPRSAPRAGYTAPPERSSADALQDGIVATRRRSSPPADLGLDIGGARIVADVSLEVARGRVRRHHRPERGGEDDALQPALRAVRPTAGTVELAGRTSRTTPPHRRTQAGLGRTFQVSSVFPLLAVARERPPRRRGGARRHAPPLAARGALRAGARPGGAGRSSGSGSPTASALAGRAALARRQAEARARDAPRGRPARDPARRADGRRLGRGRRRARRADPLGARATSGRRC